MHDTPSHQVYIYNSLKVVSNAVKSLTYIYNSLKGIQCTCEMDVTLDSLHKYFFCAIHG